MKKIKEALYAPLLEEKKSKSTTAVPYTADRNVNESDIAEELLVFETSQSLMKIMLDDDTIIHKETEKLFRVTLDSSQSSILLIDETYSIMSEITSHIEFLKLPETFEGSTHTKGEWSREYHSICNKYLLPQEAQNDIINLIFNTGFATADLPVALTTSGKKRFKRRFHDPNDSEYDNSDDPSIFASNTLSKVIDYIRKASQWIKLNQCENSCCCVYVGKLNNVFA